MLAGGAVDWLLHRNPTDHRQTYGGGAEANSDPAATADARLAGGNGKMAAVRGEGILLLPCRTWKRSETDRVSERGDAPGAAPASATQPTEPLDLGTLPGKLRRPAPGNHYPASVPKCALRRQASKVGTVCASSASTGLCGGCRAIGIPTATESSGVKVPVPSIACIRAVSMSGACGGNEARSART